MEVFVSLLVLVFLPLIAILICKVLPLWIAGKVVKAQRPGIFRAMWTYLVLYIFLIIVLLVIFKGNFQFETSSIVLIVVFDSLLFLAGALFLKKSYGVSADKTALYLLVGVLGNIAFAFIVWYLISLGSLSVLNQLLMGSNSIVMVK